MVKALGAALKWLLLCLLPFYLGACLFICGIVWLTADLESVTMDLPIIAILCVPLAGMMAAGWSIPPHRSNHRL